MSVRLLLKKTNFTHQKSLCERVKALQSVQFLRLSGLTEPDETEIVVYPETKILKVAIVGRPNAGKSTLINSILDLNICGVSQKTHTTKTHLRAAFTKGDTQVVFVDTPGFVTAKEFSRFNLSDTFLNWKDKVLKRVDIIGVIHEVTEPKDIRRFHLNLIQHINDFPETKEVFLMLNKLDLVLDKEGLSAAIAELLSSQDLNKSDKVKFPKIWQKFSKIFFTSALTGRGVPEVVNYLLEQAKPGKWIFEPDKLCDKSLHLIVIDLLRAQLLEVLPNEVPYQCGVEVEYLSENKLGEIICVALLTPRLRRHVHFITQHGNLGRLSRALESDLYKVLKKVFKIRIVIIPPQNKSKKGDKKGSF